MTIPATPSRAVTTFAVDPHSLTDAVRVLCSPLAHPSPTAWRAAAQEAVARVIGDELAAFLQPDRDPTPADGTTGALSGCAPGSDRFPVPSDDQRAILEALVCAYGAGLNTLQQLEQVRSALLHQLEATATSAVLFDLDGDEVARTSPLGHLLGGQAAPVLEAMQELARRVGALVRQRAPLAPDAERPASPPAAVRAGGSVGPVITRVGARGYVLSPVVHPDLLAWRGTAVMIVVQGERRGATDTALRDRHGLTPREVDVARALSTGAAIDEIAARLGVTVHTVRRHSEQVYRKLGVNTRRQLTERLKGAADDTRRRERCA